jgi:hypothetical protein
VGALALIVGFESADGEDCAAAVNVADWRIAVERVMVMKT